MLKVLDGIHEAIGNTPIVNLRRLTSKYGVLGNIFAKLEYLNPGYSKKDRIAKQIIEEAERDGSLKPGQAVVELTSGNTGTGLAIVCAVKGYKFYALMSKGNSEERARMMRALGAEVVLVDQTPNSVKGQVSGEDLALVEKKASELTVELGAFRADQFNLQGNVHAHEYYTAEEIWEQCDGNINAFADFMGSGGTFAGCAKALKKHDKNIRCYAVEPEAAAIYSKKQITNGNHKIQGGGYAMTLPLVPTELIDDLITVSDEKAIETARALAQYEGVFAGYSSGANVYAAIHLLQGQEKGKNIVVLLNDSGLKYLSTDLFVS
jgi:cysteine synthase A